MKLEKAGAQASLEMAIAIACILILFLASIRLFFWLNQRLVLRQEAYENTRVSATDENRTTQLYVNESGMPKLRLLDNVGAASTSTGSTSTSSSNTTSGGTSNDSLTCYQECQSQGLVGAAMTQCIQGCLGYN